MRSNWFKAVLLSALMVTSLAAFLLVAIPTEFVKANPGTAVENFLPTDDTHVQSGTPDTPFEGGISYQMYVGYDATEFGAERIYVKFDLRGLNDNAVIENAFLRVYNKYTPSIGEDPYTEKTLTVEAREVDNDDWTETTLTYNKAIENHPMGPVLDTKFIDNGPGFDVPPENWGPWWRSFNVTSWVENQLKGDKIVSIGLRNKVEADDNVVWFYQKDAYETQPRVHLQVIGENLYPPYWVEMDVPRYERDRDGLPGGTLTYQITVTNRGTENDDINLTVVDNLGWCSTADFSENKLWVENGKENQTTLTVKIPDDAPYRITDNITITATSEGNPAKSDSEKCTAYSATWISPPEADAGVTENTPNTNYGEKYYMYLGSSTTSRKNQRLYLKFDLSNGLPEDYTIENARLYLYCYADIGAAGKNVQYYGLENDNWSEGAVTWNAQPGGGQTLLGTVPVMSSGWTSWDVESFAQSQRNIDNIVSLMLKAENEGLSGPDDNFAYGFYTREPTDGDITQRPYIAFGVRPVASYFTENYGSPGENVIVNAVINNRGAVVDNYDVTVASQSGWTVSPTATVLNNVSPGENREVPVTVTIPGGATPKTWENLILTVTSKTDNAYSSSITDAGAWVGYIFDLVGGKWNLVGFPATDENTAPDNVLPETYYIWRWDPVGGTYVSPSSTVPVDENIGYWIWVEGSWEVSIGVPVASGSIDLVGGKWNLVHFPATNANTTPESLFAGYTYYIWKWDPVGGTYVSPSSTAPVELSVGYWVWIDSDKTVTVPVT